jgi:hypothetical protein
MPDEAKFEHLPANNHNSLHDVGRHMGNQDCTLNHQVEKVFTMAKLLHIPVFLSRAEHG